MVYREYFGVGSAGERRPAQSTAKDAKSTFFTWLFTAIQNVTGANRGGTKYHMPIGERGYIPKGQRKGTSINKNINNYMCIVVVETCW